MRPRLSFANVVSVLALFVALGGSAYAFHLGKNSVGSTQLKRNAVTTAKIKDRAVTAAKLSGVAPSAVNAPTVGGMSVDEIAQNSKLRCPTGTELVASICFESTVRSPKNFYEAVETCAAAGRTLPSNGEMGTYFDAKGGPNNQYFWTDTFFLNEGEFHGGIIQGLGNTRLLLNVGGALLSLRFLCVTPPTN
jgi:hypothetical protein